MIYYVEDETNIRELVLYTLAQTSFEARGFENAEQFYKAMDEALPELILLDVMLPGEDGISILKRLRGADATKHIPVILLTARGAEYDKVTGLDNGADDYITKPFGMMELISRIKAVLRRASPKEATDILIIDGLILNTQKHTVTSAGQAVSLSFKEFSLLRFLMENRGRVFTRDRLLTAVWGYDYAGGTRTVDVHIQTLRQKLGECAYIIETVRGVGYRAKE